MGAWWLVGGDPHSMECDLWPKWPNRILECSLMMMMMLFVGRQRALSVHSGWLVGLYKSGDSVN